ncbi:MAG: type II secretion system protein GspM [Sandaracinaceae bacterium]
MSSLRAQSIPGRLLAAGLLACLAAGAYVLAVAPYLAALDGAVARVGAAEQRLAGLAALAARRPALEAALARDEAAPAVRKLTIEAESHALATALFQSQVLAAFDRHGAAVSRVSALDARDADGREVRISATLSGSLETLTRSLEDLETGAPAGFVRSLTLSAPRRTPSADATLALTVEIVGFMVPAEES